MRGFAFLAVLLVLAAEAALSSGSEEGWVLADAAVAKIDQSVITVSDLRAEMEIIGWPGELAPPGPRVVAREMVKRKLLFYQAEKLRMVAQQDAIEKEVDALASKGRGEDAFWAKMEELGLSRASVLQRMREVALSRSYVSLKRRSTYVPEADVRAFYRDNKSVFGDRPITEVRDMVREHLAVRKYQAELASWVDEQTRVGRVRIMQLPDALLR